MIHEERKFNGILLPLVSRAITDRVGEVMGITHRELSIGPDQIKFSYAFPKDKGLSNVALFWLENCNQSGPYSMRACYYWLLPSFSKSPGGQAVRVRPNEHASSGDYGFIFWQNGKPTSLGQQYVVGSNICRKLPADKSLYDVIEAWENDEYDVRFSRTLGEMNNILGAAIKNLPKPKLDRPRERLLLKARDAGWDEATSALAYEVA